MVKNSQKKGSPLKEGEPNGGVKNLLQKGYLPIVCLEVESDSDRCGTCLGCDLPLDKDCEVCLNDLRPGRIPIRREQAEQKEEYVGGEQLDLFDEMF